MDLVEPESNIYYEKYHKVLEDVGIECWTVEDFSFFETPLFKVLYFQLLAVYCSLTENNLRTEKHILKTLFLFHQHLINDYLQWKKMNHKTNHQEENQERPIEWTSKIDLQPFKEQQTYQKIEHNLESIQLYYYPTNNVLIMTFPSTAELSHLATRAMKWNGFVESYSLN